MVFALFIGIASAFVILICLCRMDIRKFMGYPAVMDILVTMLLIVMLHGSYVGMVAAIIGGLVFSGLITVIRRYYGYKKLTLKGWVSYDGSITTKLKNIEYQSSTFKETLTSKGTTLCSKLKSLNLPLAFTSLFFLWLLVA